MKILFIGCVQFSYNALNHLLSLQYPNLELVGIVTRKESPVNSDFQSLEPIAKQYKIPYFLAKKNDQDSMANWIKQLDVDVVYCFGWSYLLKTEILSLPKLGVIGYHPTNLPENRGRHPIIWALALGLDETASTFFFMDEGADSGDILSQKEIAIDSEDNAEILYEKLTHIAMEQLEAFTYDLLMEKHERIPQDHSKANYWRKRSKKDGEIDWRMSASSIYNLVRALSYPYPGAHCIVNGKEIKVWKTQFANAAGLENHEAGKILHVRHSKITIKCGEGAIILTEHELKELPKEGSYL